MPVLTSLFLLLTGRVGPPIAWEDYVCSQGSACTKPLTPFYGSEAEEQPANTGLNMTLEMETKESVQKP